MSVEIPKSSSVFHGYFEIAMFYLLLFLLLFFFTSKSFKFPAKDMP